VRLDGNSPRLPPDAPIAAARGLVLTAAEGEAYEQICLPPTVRGAIQDDLVLSLSTVVVNPKDCQHDGCDRHGASDDPLGARV
jgi:hypothetical protein